MAVDLANVSNRMAPGLPGTSPPKIAFANGANAAVQLRATAGAAIYISVKVTAGACIATGDSNVGAPTTNDPRFDASDGWQDMILAVGATHIRIFGDGSAGTLYVWLSGG